MLLDLPIQRFVTTNYDSEIEKALTKRLGPADWSYEKSFLNSRTGVRFLLQWRLAAKIDRWYSTATAAWKVTAAYGRVEQEQTRAQRPERRLVLTEADYKHWYLSTRGDVYTLQRSLDVILQSNPLLFVGYSIDDFDVLRILRRATLRWESERVASNLFLLLPLDERVPDDPVARGAWSLAKQIRLGVNLLPV